MNSGRRSDKEVLLNEIPKEESIGNISLLDKLKGRGWDEDKYWRVRDELVNDGLIERGRGKGGSVRRLTTQDKSSFASKRKKTPESKLYEPLAATLKDLWVRDQNIDPSHITFEITARQGAKQTGGKWSRPDIVAVSVRTFPHLPSKYLDVWTFEVKPVEWLDVTAIFEAAAHASRATRSYALLQVDEKQDRQYVLERCETEAARLRVGLITFSDPSKFATWETLVEAPRLDTAPENLQAQINNLSEDTKNRILTWR